MAMARVISSSVGSRAYRATVLYLQPASRLPTKPVCNGFGPFGLRPLCRLVRISLLFGVAYVALHDVRPRREEPLCVPRLKAEHRETRILQRAVNPLREWTGLKPDQGYFPLQLRKLRDDFCRLRASCHLENV